MKKDDKQPKKPRKKPQSKAAKQPAKKPKVDDTKPIEITLPVKRTPTEVTPAHVFRDASIARQKKGKHKSDDKGLSVDEWQKLLKQNPDLLTPFQARQLAEANKVAIEMAKRITSQYDFSAIAKTLRTVDTFPIARITQDIQQLALGTQKLQTNFILPAQQLVHTTEVLLSMTMTNMLRT